MKRFDLKRSVSQRKGNKFCMKVFGATTPTNIAYDKDMSNAMRIDTDMSASATCGHILGLPTFHEHSQAGRPLPG
eukprot:scaffold88050_cov15-Prasinocladus_malaysianus.AAC.1